ncbi:MAG: DEAD/DEAH box helicase family protein, partial [Chloroflexota bacterium]|nr:DEAD/DEAH box helicase family protein [Chloroflexota bacterium]
MAPATIDRLIINAPYGEPSQHWLYERQTRSWSRVPGRRPAGYLVASPGSKAFDDPGVFLPIPLVNQIRPRVKAWRDAGYPGATGVTKRLLEHWYDLAERRDRRFFFCQLEAIETLIWLAESPPADRVGIDIPGDGGAFQRLCSKMATGTGKTVVMTMLIAWQALNKVTYPQDTRFSKNILVIAPGLTIWSRLQVLVPSNTSNYYDEFNIVPPGLGDALRQAKVRVRNWHKLNWESSEQLAKKKSVDKRGPKSDEAYVRDVLGKMASARNLLVINDEAHHAWRVAAGSKLRGVSKDDADQAAKWIGGLDRIHRARGVLRCYDFSATPFIPTGGASS